MEMSMSSSINGLPGSDTLSAYDVEGVGGAGTTSGTGNTSGAVGDTASFGDELSQAINGTGEMLAKADTQANQLAHGKGNLHETALALEEADISMRFLVKARNKVIDAYQEIMRMPV
jgi:flagellar hook-basal body complex protein FliE